MEIDFQTIWNVASAIVVGSSIFSINLIIFFISSARLLSIVIYSITFVSTVSN